MKKSQQGHFSLLSRDSFEKEMIALLRKNGHIGVRDYKDLGCMPDRGGEKYRANMQTLRRRLEHIAQVLDARLSKDGLEINLGELEGSIERQVRNFVLSGSLLPTLEETAAHVGRPPKEIKEEYYKAAQKRKPPVEPIIP